MAGLVAEVPVANEDHGLARRQYGDEHLPGDEPPRRSGITVLAEGRLDPHTQSVHGDWNIDFASMHQTNTSSSTVRLVRRMLVSFRPLA